MIEGALSAALEPDEAVRAAAHVRTPTSKPRSRKQPDLVKRR